jgi:hypothetical protein
MDKLETWLLSLAGSKAATAIGGLLALIGTICGTMRGDVADLAPVWGIRVCAAAAILGTLLAMAGRSALDRRNHADATPGTAKMAAFTSDPYVHPHRRTRA